MNQKILFGCVLLSLLGFGLGLYDASNVGRYSDYEWAEYLFD